MQTRVTRRVFRRPSLARAISELLDHPAFNNEQELLDHAARVIALHVSAERAELRDIDSANTIFLPEVSTLADAWANVIVPLRFSQGEGLPFQRVHRNALVNITHVRKMAALTSHRWLLTLQNDQEFVVSKRQARTVRESFGL